MQVALMCPPPHNTYVLSLGRHEADISLQRSTIHVGLQSLLTSRAIPTTTGHTQMASLCPPGTITFLSE
ncbi:hypothetical protein E2C01_043798 [Portunus trituberculatus]|uniref:Uncharacterized protein n=1 Tax=Portunus trituberculatus TaxID=210409 RepID=A0A5B7FQE5_PORTR|nr:hypothetical protein [Portunus trituberculatus]